MAPRSRALISVGLGSGIQLRSSIVIAMDRWVVAARATVPAVPNKQSRRVMVQRLLAAGQLGPGFARRRRRAGYPHDGEALRHAIRARQPPALHRSLWQHARI